jgi:predicted ABC-type transport system involved in lysophospholipase L1 biosynthesis ATPase subunit
VLSTHDPAVAARLDEQWLISDGRLAASVRTEAGR